MEIILDPIVGAFIEKVQEIIIEEAFLTLGLKKELEKLQKMMKQIHPVIKDAEKKGKVNSSVKVWLNDLKDFMYDADDIIDLAKIKLDYPLAGHPLPESRNSTTCSGSSALSCWPRILARYDIARQIRDLNDTVAGILKRKEFLLFTENQTENKPYTSNATCLEHPNLVGTEILTATNRLVDLVVQNKENKLYKIAITGTGGVGKTTLAQKLFNDQRIKRNFSKLAWISVSKQYEVISLLKEVLQQVEGDKYGDSKVVLEKRIETTVRNKSILLVMDDLWEPNVWTNLLSVPLYYASALVVVFTTRSDDVALKIGADYIHHVELMLEESGWELLWSSITDSDEEKRQHLQETGMEIVKKCGGLPLAIKLIAGVLIQKERTMHNWRQILNKSEWTMQNLPPELEGALYISYDDLPSYLKQCFLYCGLYKEDWNMNCDHLVRYWVAEGFVTDQNDKLAEDIAEEYYYELIRRNILHPKQDTFDEWSTMHDLLRLLAHHLSGEECMIGDPQSLNPTTPKLRRVSIFTDNDKLEFPNIDKKKNKIRTLWNCYDQSLMKRNLNLRKFPCLRVLDLTGSFVQSIPESIRDLIHLRFLSLDETKITCLPESIGLLRELQFLNMQNCYELHSLPSKITQLCNLRRLGIKDTPITQVPKGIGRLISLNDLEGFPIGGYNNDNIQDGWNLHELHPLVKLRRLHMTHLERAINGDAITSLLRDKTHLKVLHLCYGNQFSDEVISRIMKTSDELVPPQNLENLTVEGFIGRHYPTWLGTELPSLKFMKLINCTSWERLPPIGVQPVLKSLTITGASAIIKIGKDILGSGDSTTFPSLEHLQITDMSNWQEWSMTEHQAEQDEENQTATIIPVVTPSLKQLFPRLKKLQLFRCPKLRSLPKQLAHASSLKELEIEEASHLEVVENLPHLSYWLSITGCGKLWKVSGLPNVRELWVSRCPALHCVEKLDSLESMMLSDDMYRRVNPQWLDQLQNHPQDLQGKAPKLYTWKL